MRSMVTEFKEFQENVFTVFSKETLLSKIDTVYCVSDSAALVPRVETVCERWKLSLMSHYNGQPSPQDYMPLCDTHGNFLPVQCYGNSSFCWCVDHQGVEIIGTRSYNDVKPPCE